MSVQHIEAIEAIEMQFPVQSPLPAVLVRDIHVSFGKNVVLNNFNMTVATGSIYGLLGPSGCGKTSLIRSILGMHNVKHGSIEVYGGKATPDINVGYMPQDYTLFQEMNVREILSYFGTLYLLESNYIKHRISFLLNLLDLTDKLNKRIQNLSGGQKRRVSLAIAMIHSPRLLLLDEPSVGLDPPLRQSIWNHLIHLCQNNERAVVISTHYIEETRNVNRIGLIRHGSMLIEGNPRILLDRYHVNSLEALFLRLCQTVDVNQNVEENLLPPANTNSDAISYPKATPDNNDNVEQHVPQILPPIDECSFGRRTLAMIKKNILFLMRNPAYLLFQFFLPTAELFLFSICIGLQLYNIPVSVYNGDPNSIFISNMLNSVDHQILRLVDYPSEQSAIDAVRSAASQAALVIPPQFTEALRDRILLFGEIDNKTLYSSTIKIFADHSNPIMGVTIYQNLVESFTVIGKDYLTSMNMSPLLLELPMQFSTPVFGSTNSTMNDFMIPGVIFSIAFLAAIPLTALSLVTERRSGLIERTLSTGVTHFSFVFSLIITQFLVLVVQVILLMLVVHFLIEYEFQGQWLTIGLLTILQSFCGMSFGLLVSSISTSETFATMLALGSFYPNLLISGAVWPIEGANYYVRKICYIFPQTYPIEAVRAMFTRGWGIEQQLVQYGFAVTTIWILVFIGFATLALKYLKM